MAWRSPTAWTNKSVVNKERRRSYLSKSAAGVVNSVERGQGANRKSRFALNKLK